MAAANAAGASSRNIHARWVGPSAWAHAELPTRGTRSMGIASSRAGRPVLFIGGVEIRCHEAVLAWLDTLPGGS